MFVIFPGISGEFAINTDAISQVNRGSGQNTHILTKDNELLRVKLSFDTVVAILNGAIL
jgi:hypothetical protein